MADKNDQTPEQPNNNGKVEGWQPTLVQRVDVGPNSQATDHIMELFEITDRAAAHDILKERD